MSKFDGESGHAKTLHQVSENAAWANKMAMVTKPGYSFVDGDICNHYVLVYKSGPLETPDRITTELSVLQLLDVVREIQSFEPVKTQLQADQNRKALLAQHSLSAISPSQNPENQTTPT